MCSSSSILIQPTILKYSHLYFQAFSENFLSGEMPVEAFLDSYLDKRKLTHLRRVKAEKMADLLNQTGANRNSAPPTQRSMPPAPGNPPYPNSYAPPYRPYAYPTSQEPFFYPKI